MNTTLVGLVVLYILGTIAVGIYAGSRVKNASDFALAGRSLPLALVITTTFATWFGAETIMGISAKFVQGGLNAVVEDPFGASFCLILVGLFFAYKLYSMNLLTIGDYYRQRFGELVEVLCSLAIIASYLGWVAAQVTAIGLVINLITNGVVSVEAGMVIGILSVLIYVSFGGMLAVAWADFIQVLVLVVGLTAVAFMAASLAGGADKVVALAHSKDWFKFWPEPNFKDMVFFLAAAVTMMLGSIPQQDVFQRVMAAKDIKAATRGPVIGGLCYLAFAFVPMFIVAAAMLVMPKEAAELVKSDYQRVLPTFIMTHMPLFMQILFFGALLSAIQSCSSATLLAPSTSFVENILKNIFPKMTDHQVLWAMRVTLVVFSMGVLAYALFMRGTSIYELVSSAYQVTLCTAFVPLAFGLYWKKSTTQGALLSILAGAGVWLFFLSNKALGEAFPAQLAGLLASVVGMILGSLLPQWFRSRTAGHSNAETLETAQRTSPL
jgi:solute:Na+ symporter, SSS family